MFAWYPAGPDDAFFFQAEDGIRDAQESRGLGDVYKRQMSAIVVRPYPFATNSSCAAARMRRRCLLYTSDAADDLTRVDLGGPRIIQKKNRVGTRVYLQRGDRRSPMVRYGDSIN